MEISIEKTAQDCISAISEKVRNLKTLNIIVAGKKAVCNVAQSLLLAA